MRADAVQKVQVFLAVVLRTVRIGTMIRLLRIGIVVLVMVAVGQDVCAQAIGDSLGPREIALGEAMRGDARGALATTINPAGLSLNRELVFEGAFGYRPEDGASIVNASACDSTTAVAACTYYRYFSASPDLDGTEFSRRSHELGTVLSTMLSSNILVGATGRYFDYNTELTGESDSKGFSFDVGAILRATKVFNLALVGYNVVGDDSNQYPMGIGAGIMARPFELLTIGFDTRWNLDADDKSKARYGGGAEFLVRTSNMQKAFPIRAGGVYDSEMKSAFVTAGVGFMSTKMGIDLGGRRQVSGGDNEMVIQASLRLFGASPTNDHPPLNGVALPWSSATLPTLGYKMCF